MRARGWNCAIVHRSRIEPALHFPRLRRCWRFLYYCIVFELLFSHPTWAYRTGTFAFANAWPLWLLAVAIVTGAVAITASLWRRRQVGWRLLLPVGVLQTTLLAIVLCLLWRPVLNVERVRDRENVLAVALDASASMTYGDAERSRLQEVAAALQQGTLSRLEEIFELRL